MCFSAKSAEIKVGAIKLSLQCPLHSARPHLDILGALLKPGCKCFKVHYGRWWFLIKDLDQLGCSLLNSFEGVLEKFCSSNSYPVLLISNFTNGEMDESCGSVYFPTSVNEFNKIIHQLSHGTTEYIFAILMTFLTLNSKFVAIYAPKQCATTKQTLSFLSVALFCLFDPDLAL